MSRQILKYPLELTARAQPVPMPAGARVVHVQEQHGLPTMWAEVDPRNVTEQRNFRVFATGEDIPEAWHNYIGTVHISWTVWHIYEGRRM